MTERGLPLKVSQFRGLDSLEANKLMTIRNPIAHPTVFLRSNLLENIRFEKQLQPGQDYAMWVENYKVFNWYVTEQPLVYWRKHGSNITQKNNLIDPTFISKLAPLYADLGIRFDFQLISGGYLSSNLIELGLVLKELESYSKELIGNSLNKHYIDAVRYTVLSIQVSTIKKNVNLLGTKIDKEILILFKNYLVMNHNQWVEALKFKYIK
jgi:hypothetical protein